MHHLPFTATLKVADKTLDFQFTQMPGEYQQFIGQVNDANGKAITFSLYCDAHGRWHTTGKMLPLWIANAETEIGQAISVRS